MSICAFMPKAFTPYPSRPDKQLGQVCNDRVSRASDGVGIDLLDATLACFVACHSLV